MSTNALPVVPGLAADHFGARSALLAAIFERIAERSRTAALDSVRAVDAPTAVRSTWDSLAHPGQRQMWTTFFEVYAAALRSPDEHGGFLNHVSRDWVEPLTALMVAEGTDQALAAARATFVVATVRGLILDRLAGGDEARIDGALALLIEQVGAVR